MKRLAALCLLLAFHPGFAHAQNSAPRAAVPVTPAAVRGVLYARPFTLAAGYRNTWSKERELVTSGTIVVLAVDPALVVPRNALEPVLYGGDRPVQRLNHGDKSGRVIAIVPNVTNITGLPFWFGKPELPERITKEFARAERARAEAAGVLPPATSVARGVMRPRLFAPDMPALLRTEAAELVLRFAAEDWEIAAAWRLPVARSPRGKRP